MPDIREILNALSIDDRALWSEQRTIMRRAYLNAHNETVGVCGWTHEDDAFLDLIDIRLALLFDRCGKLDATKDIIGNDAAKIEKYIYDKEDAMKAIKQGEFTDMPKLDDSRHTEMSAASQLLYTIGQNDKANNSLGSAPTW